jgi:hypothetical protein
LGWKGAGTIPEIRNDAALAETGVGRRDLPCPQSIRRALHPAWDACWAAATPCATAPLPHGPAGGGSSRTGSGFGVWGERLGSFDGSGLPGSAAGRLPAPTGDHPRNSRSLRSAYRSFSCGFGQPRATDHRCHLLNDKCAARSDGFLPRVKLAPRPEPKADPVPQSDSLWVHAFLCALLWQSILDWPHEAQNAQEGAPDIDHGFRGYRGFNP